MLIASFGLILEQLFGQARLFSSGQLFTEVRHAAVGGTGGNAPQMKKTYMNLPPHRIIDNIIFAKPVSCITFLPPKVRGKEDIAPQVNVSSYVDVRGVPAHQDTGIFLVGCLNSWK